MMALLCLQLAPGPCRVTCPLGPWDFSPDLPQSAWQGYSEGDSGSQCLAGLLTGGLGIASLQGPVSPLHGPEPEGAGWVASPEGERT